MPPLTPSRIRATTASSPVSPLGAVVVLELSAGELLEGNREVVARLSVDHRRCVLLVAALAKGAVVAVELPRPLRRDENGGVVGIGALEELVYAWFDHCDPDDRAPRSIGARLRWPRGKRGGSMN